ncbi:nuclear transport factor 2 family protein [Microbacterium sp. G2-8]|uniref:nuclear transport factor 2 family protein n=1 Tax=Microbacterium sp. G2-8 TaxID=2842454 RepID=UPI001C89DB3A|nr:nuclear transport factor 2 family protein [Microbacterium sp. G2-8]
MHDELLDLEHQGWASLCNGTGADFYGRIMTAEGVMVLAHGQRFDRQAVIDSLDQAPTWTSYEIADERVIHAGADHAILSYIGCGYRDGEPPFAALMSSVYVRQDGAWRLALYQQTPVPAA